MAVKKVLNAALAVVAAVANAPPITVKAVLIPDTTAVNPNILTARSPSAIASPAVALLRPSEVLPLGSNKSANSVRNSTKNLTAGGTDSFLQIQRLM